jgi:O-antigen biosynthesis protein WbqV
LIAAPRTADHGVLSRALDELVRSAAAGHATETLAMVKRLVPEYAGQNSTGREHSALSAG